LDGSGESKIDGSLFDSSYRSDYCSDGSEIVSFSEEQLSTSLDVSLTSFTCSRILTSALVCDCALAGYSCAVIPLCVDAPDRLFS
jgi:hypothetical protein